MPAFTMTDFLITMSVLVLFLAVLAVLAYREARNKKREADQWPTATNKKFDKVNRKALNKKLSNPLPWDPTQDMYN